MSGSSKLSHGLAKVLGIKLDQRHEIETEKITRGESVFSVTSADTYVEHEPTVAEWFGEITPSGKDVVDYARSLFPFTSWIHRYNLQWLIGDLVAGITIGAVVVPQSMAYASLAELPAQYGLYSAFMGVLIYWFFATSKDITIGPVAVMSTIVGNIVIDTRGHVPYIAPHVIAQALAIIAGAIICFMGLIRIGWIVEFISLAAISAFITGSAFSIAMGQIPALLGISKTYVNTHVATYQVVISTLQNLQHANIGAAIGITALAMLYILKYTFVFAAKRYPQHQRLFFFLGTLRTAFVILLYTLITWLVNRGVASGPKNYANAKWSILGPVPRGFQEAGVPKINTGIIKAFASKLPASVIVLLIEHISISKSFGRINNYTINPSQELLAIGVTNLLGPFLGAYPATGSFSRTAIKSKAGVRTPLAGVVTAVVVLLAIYALPSLFFWIPSAGLSAVIIHAVLDLITPANTVYKFWRISPLEVVIFLAGVFVTVFSSIENGVYTTICTSAALLLYRIVKARGRFLGRVKVHSVVGDHIDGEKGGDPSAVREAFIPIDHRDGSNPGINVEKPYPGIFIYRFSEGFNYPNASHYLDHVVQTIFAETRRTTADSYGRPGDRPWNNPGPRKGHEEAELAKRANLPTLKAIVLDFSSVNNVDITSVQNLIDVRNQLDRYASPDTVQWHFASINNRWTKRALVSAGFGYPSNAEDEAGDFHRWKPIYSVAEIGHDSAAQAAENAENARRRTQTDLEGGRLSNAIPARIAVVHGLNRPLFHLDLAAALQSAIAGVEGRERAAQEAAADRAPQIGGKELEVSTQQRRGSGSNDS